MSAHEADRGPVRIGELSRRVGVTPEVLRAWERRYGILSPTRTDGGFRLYGEDDERRIRRMLQHLEPGREGVERSEQVVPGDSQIEGEVVARPGGKADERQVVLCRRSGDCRQRAVTAGHAQRVGSVVDGDRNERREVVCRSEHDRLDASFACSVSEGRPRCLAVAGPGIDQQHGSPRRIDALPFFSQSSKTGGHAHHRTLVSSTADRRCR